MAILAASALPAAGGGGGLRLAKVGDFDQPTYVHGPKGAGDVVFVVEQPGVVRVLRGDRKLGGAFLNIKGRVSCCGERGLLSIAFPSFKGSRRFYVYFTDNQGDVRVVEYKRKRGKLKAKKSSARDILEIPTSDSRTTMAASSSSVQTATSGSGPGTAAVPEIPPATPRTSAVCSASCSASTSPERARPSPTRFPKGTPTGAARRGVTRSTLAACGTRGASPSPGTRSSLGTSARTRSRRSTTSAAAAREAPTSAGMRSRATPW